jgi:RNA polymerase sigma-70 factor (ECF subfamily)
MVRPTSEDSECRDPLEWLLADERRQLVRAALERLPRRDTELLLLKYTEDWSYRELAARLSESAIEARLHRARARLRAELTTLNVIEVSQ